MPQQLLPNRYLLASWVAMHRNVLLGPNVAVLPGPALARFILEANPLNVVLRTHINQEVR
jgi:hypothetical protein